MSKRYRRNVAAVVLNEEGLILACQRSDKYASWQFPQGGVDEGESPEAAVFRELLEEIGTQAVELLGQLPNMIRYDWPEGRIMVPGYDGQEQCYFLFRLKPGASIDLQAHEPHEFQAYRWLSAEEFLQLNIGFKREAYQQALRQLQEHFPNLIRERPSR